MNPIRYGEDEPRHRLHLTRSHMTTLALVFFVATLGAAMLASALTCPC